MKFSYVTLNQEHQKLTGVLTAENEAEARTKLHGMGLSVIQLQEVEESNEEQTEQDINSFAFHVRDSHGNETYGTIDAKDRTHAYCRLVSEYGFEVLSLCDTALPESDWEEEGKRGLAELAIEVEEEFGIAPKDLNQSDDDKSTVKNEAFIESKKELVANVEEIVNKAESVLEKYNEEMDVDDYREMKVKIDDLMRLRLSNNLKYIQDLADELLILTDQVVRKYGTEQEAKEIRTKSEVKEEKTDELDTQSGHGALARIKSITKAMGKLLGGKKKRRRRRIVHKKARKGIGNTAVMIKARLILRTIGKLFSTLKRVIVSKNAAVRSAYMQQLRSHLHELKDILEAGEEKLAERQGIEVEVEAVGDEDLDLEREFRQSLLYRAFSEIHLFFGWLLAFYVIYFYFSAFAIVKWGADFPLFSFVYRSLSSSFPFIITGFFFIVFLGLTLNLRLSHGRIWATSTYSLLTVMLVLLFFFNF